jgi:hypothetical protein
MGGARSRARSGSTALAALTLGLLLAASAWASGTLTNPVNGPTVTLDANHGMTFTWALPPNELGGSVSISDTTIYDRASGDSSRP